MAWRPIASFTGHRGAVYALAHGDRPGTFFSAGSDGRVVRWDPDRPDRGELIATLDRPVFAMHHDRERHMLFMGKDDGGMHVLDLEGMRETHLFTVHRKGIFSIHPLSGDRFACAAGDGSISVWRSGPVELIRQIPICGEKVRDLSLNADGRWLVVADGEGALRILDTTDLNEHHRVHAHDGGCTSVIFHPTKPVVISGGKDGHLRTWDGIDLRPVHAIAAHGGSVYMIAFSPDGTICATASRDKTVKLWDAATLDPVARLDRATSGHSHSVNVLLWLDNTLISAGDDGRVLAWSAT